MNAENLEALLIDRVFGQLSPEVEMLLAEHLAANPESARLAAELSETVELAATALHRPAPRLDLPPPAIAMFPPRPIRRVLALAASFAAGVGVAQLGLHSLRPQSAAPLAQAPATAPAVIPAPAPHRVETDPIVRSLPFWSKQRAVVLAVAKQSTH